MKFALILAVVLLASAPLAYPQKVTVKFDKAAPFAGYKTYKFERESGARNPMVSQLIVTAVERELNARGLKKVEADPDLRISFLAASGMDLRVGEVNFGYNVNPAYEGLVPVGSASWDVTTGTLLIDLFDHKTDRVIFRGTAKDVLERAPSADMAADAKLVSKQVSKGIAKIFKKYPKKP
jgi:Domain of unknown function (DUF4136)